MPLIRQARPHRPPPYAQQAKLLIGASIVNGKERWEQDDYMYPKEKVRRLWPSSRYTRQRACFAIDNRLIASACADDQSLAGLQDGIFVQAIQ